MVLSEFLVVRLLQRPPSNNRRCQLLRESIINACNFISYYVLLVSGFLQGCVTKISAVNSEHEADLQHSALMQTIFQFAV